MAVDFEALDLVRSENKSRSYHSKVVKLEQQLKELAILAAQAIDDVKLLEKPHFMDHTGKAALLEEKLKKFKTALDSDPILSYVLI